MIFISSSNDKEGKMLLNALSQYNRPLEIKFDEMLKLMDQCEQVDKLSYLARHKYRSSQNEGSERSSSGSSSSGGNGSDFDNNDGAGNGESSLSTSTDNQDGVSLKLAANIFPRSPFSLFSGIIPGKAIAERGRGLN